MQMKEIITEHQKLNHAIKYLEYSKDQLYDYIGENSDAIEKVQSYFPIADFLLQVSKNEGAIARSDILLMIKNIDQIIMNIVRKDGFNNETK
jgi:hypothetical protein